MNGSQTFPKLSAAALEEHRQIHFHVSQLTKALEVLDDPALDGEVLLDVAARIDSLCERLEEHFRGEEDAGLYQGILDALPQVESDVMRLMAQHEKIVRELDGARSLARRKEPKDASFLRSDLERILTALSEHEREEEALVQRALSRP